METIRGLKYDSESGRISNNVNKIQLVLSKKALSPRNAAKIMSKSKAAFDLENPSGFRIKFKKYYQAKMTSYTLTGKKDSWQQSLAQAYSAGVVDYLCGTKADSAGPVPSIFDGTDRD